MFTTRTQQLAYGVAASLTLTRLFLAPIILWVSWDGTAGWPYVLCLALGFGSDILDGRVARYFKVTSTLWSRLDSFIDTIFSTAAIIAVWFVHPEVIRYYGWGMTWVVGLELTRMITDQLKFGKQASYHMWSAKIWGFCIVVGLFWLMGFGQDNWFVWLAVWWGVLAETEGLMVSWLLPRWTDNVPTLWQAWYIRQSG